MKNIIKIATLLAVFVFTACEQEIVERIDEFSLEQGGYIRTVAPFPVAATTFKVSKANMAGTKWEFTAEAVTPNAGADFQSYDWVVRFVDATPANGTNNVADKTFKSYPASAFAKDPQTGYPRATLGSTGKELLDAAGLKEEQIAIGDRFEVRGTMKLTNGKSFNASNTGANITGGAFYSSPFFYRVNVVE
jgi:hypothetical protein